MVKKGRVFIGTIDGMPSIGVYGASDVDPRIANRAASIVYGYSTFSGGVPRGFGEKGWLVVPVNPNEPPDALRTGLPMELGAIGVNVVYDTMPHSRAEVASTVGEDALLGIAHSSISEYQIVKA